MDTIYTKHSSKYSRSPETHFELNVQFYVKGKKNGQNWIKRDLQFDLWGKKNACQ